tara:strand:- start:1193 stop:2344 length:1152 start_codon:yes stop_codon:yes gene_type:complete
MKKKISILGSTGSIGLSALNIIDKKRNFFNIDLLSAKSNYKLICKQIKKYKPKIFVVKDQIIFKKIKNKYRKNKVKVLDSFNKVNLKKKTDICISAIPGFSGLEPTIFFIKFSKKILIANKESVICGWNLIKNLSQKKNTKLIPIDSEHFSILKLLENHKLAEVKKIYITASGGPFLHYKKNQMTKIKPKDALKHPKWKMGKKISIDSSTLMNKILELIEAQKIFNIPNEKIEIIIHPNSLVHAIIEFKNGLIKFLYHETSMIIPLANAIFEGNLEIENFYRKKKNKFENLIFQKVDKNLFPAIKLKSRVNEHPSTPIIINAANEVSVDQFINKKLPFLKINKIIMGVLNDKNYKKYAIRNPRTIYQIIKIDQWARETAIRLC